MYLQQHVSPLPSQQPSNYNDPLDDDDDPKLLLSFGLLCFLTEQKNITEQTGICPRDWRISRSNGRPPS